MVKKKYRSYWGKLNSKQLAQVHNYIKENIITDKKQIIQYIEKQFGVSYSKSGMNNLLHSIGFSFKQLSLIPSKADIEQQKEFVKKYNTISENLNPHDKILFIDGVHPQHNTKPSKAWIEKGTIKYIKTNTGRKRINLNGAYNPNNQDVITREDPTINAQSTLKLFKQIEDCYPNANTIYVIADNARYYRNKIVTEYLEKSKIELLFLPPYSPNLNLIERLWKFMRKKIINTTYYEDFESFKNAIITFFNEIDSYSAEIKNFIGNQFHLMNEFS